MVRVTLMRYEGRGFNVPNSYPLVASVAELMVGLCMRESNQPRPGVAPGCPQPMLRAQPCVCGAKSVYAQRCSDSPKCFCTGKRRPLQNDGLDIGTYRTRPARHGSKCNITVRGSGSRLCEARMSVWLMLAAACTQQVGGLRPRPRPAERPRAGRSTIGSL